MMDSVYDETVRRIADEYRRRSPKRKPPKRKPVGDHRMPGNVKDMTGLRFGRLTVTGYAGPYRTGRSHSCALWECRCDCGTMTCVPRTSLIKGNTKSCGCLNRELNQYRKEHHGRERHTEG